MKIAFFTLGCKVNQYETEILIQQFAKDGFEICSFDDFCDVYVINTCTVTAVSDRKSRNMIRRAKRKNPNSIVAVTGCYSQIKPDKVASLKGVDIVTGTDNRLMLPILIKKALQNKNQIINVTDSKTHVDFEPMTAHGFSSKTRAIVKIQDGCQNYCSYCIIPYARGPIRSKPAHNAIYEIEGLLKQGFSEIVLTGIHLASYKDNSGISLLELLYMIDELPYSFRLRLGSLEPTLFTDEFVNSISELKHLCPHFHISLQSGCDATLKRMNRKYTSAQYQSAVERLRCKIPDVAITTDVMVGFPGETDEEFKNSLSFVEKLGFARCHVFAFSKREGTKAANMENQLPKHIKDERSAEMFAVSEQSQQRFSEKYIGKKIDVLFEQEISKGLFEGLTSNYITVRTSYIKNLHNITVPILIQSYKNGVCYGVVKTKS